ncbi:MAG: hypothetical protein KatS3mg003_0355 [Candidatus Nitrosocaldaceae archaeon]|nr:MAG: hypothetical protein KatS3mg003_0355 [Candidatus Nitrosocaldaceae archaeon]
MRCHICNGFTDERCIICGNNACSVCTDDDGICKRCRTNYTYVGLPRLSSIANPTLFAGGIISIIIGFALVVFASMQDAQIPALDDNMNDGDGFIYIFPFIFIKSSDPLFIVPIMLLFLALPIILMLIFMRRIM